MMKWTEERRFNLFLLLTFLGGLFLAVFSTPCPNMLFHSATSKVFCSDWWQEIAHKIGDALMIATLLALIVDKSAKVKVITDVLQNVSSYIIGRLLPPELSEHLLSYLEMHLVRTSWDITYTITKAEQGYINLLTSSTDTMENRMQETMQYDFVYSLEGSLCPSDLGTSTITRVKLPNEAEVTEGFQNDENNNQNFKTRIPMKPGTTYTFDVTTSECKRESDFSLFYAKCPVMKITLTVLYPVEEFDVSLELTFFPTVPKSEEVRVGEKKGRQWTIDKPTPPMLPGQGFLLKWSAKQPLPSASPQS